MYDASSSQADANETTPTNTSRIYNTSDDSILFEYMEYRLFYGCAEDGKQICVICSTTRLLIPSSLLEILRSLYSFFRHFTWIQTFRAVVNAVKIIPNPSTSIESFAHSWDSLVNRNPNESLLIHHCPLKFFLRILVMFQRPAHLPLLMAFLAAAEIICLVYVCIADKKLHNSCKEMVNVSPIDSLLLESISF